MIFLKSILVVIIAGFTLATNSTNDDNPTTTTAPTTTIIYDDSRGRSMFNDDDQQLPRQGRIINDEKISIKGFIPIVGLASTNDKLSSNNGDDNRNIDKRNNQPSLSSYDDNVDHESIPQHQAGPEDQRFIGAALQGLIGNFAGGNNMVGSIQRPISNQQQSILQRKIDCICVPFYMCRNGFLVGSAIDPYNNLNQQRKNDQQQQQQQQFDDDMIYAAINERSLDGNSNHQNNTKKFTEEILERMIGSSSSLNRQMTDKCGLLRTCCQQQRSSSSYNLNPMIMNDQQLNFDYIGSNVPGYNLGQSSHYRPTHQSPLEQVYHHTHNHHQHQQQYQPVPIKANRPRPPPPSNYRPPKVIHSLHSHSIPSYDHTIQPSLPIPIRNEHLPRPSSSSNLAYQNCGQRQSIGINGRVQNLNYHQSSTEFAEFPWQVAILKRIGPSDNLYVCGGALISSGFIMTAAHCIKKFQAQDLKIRLGEWDVHREDEFYPYVEKNVEEIFIHPNFVPRNLMNDVALLKLDTELDLSQHPHISPICMPQSYDSFSGQRCYVAGWGKNAFGHQGEYQSVLMKVDLPVLDTRICENQLKQTKLGYNFRLDRSMICAGGEPGKDACEGDGGSGLVCETNGQWNVVGLVSWGLGCGQGGVPGVYTNVGHIRHWVDKIILPYYNNHHNHHHHQISKSIPNFNELINERSLNNENQQQILNDTMLVTPKITDNNNNNGTNIENKEKSN